MSHPKYFLYLIVLTLMYSLSFLSASLLYYVVILFPILLKIDKKQRIKLIVDRITPTKNIFNLHINIIRIFLWDIRIFIKGKNVLFS